MTLFSHTQYLQPTTKNNFLEPLALRHKSFFCFAFINTLSVYHLKLLPTTEVLTNVTKASVAIFLVKRHLNYLEMYDSFLLAVIPLYVFPGAGCPFSTRTI